MTAAADAHKLTLEWPSTGARSVIVTGTFDDWAKTLYLTKTSTGFETTINVPWDTKVKYKYIVDGQWICRQDRPKETDPGGFVNNVYTTPPQPTLEAVLSPESVNGHPVNGHAASSSEDAALHAHSSTEAEIKQNGDASSNLATTIVAREGTTSVLDYVASGFGAAVHSVVGVDPINSQKIAIPTPTIDDHFELPAEPLSASKETDDSSTISPPLPSSPVAPVVPIMIVPVNAAENNTTTSSLPPKGVIIPVPPSESTVPIEVPELDLSPKADVVEPVSEQTVVPAVEGSVTVPVSEVPEIPELTVEPAVTELPEASHTGVKILTVEEVDIKVDSVTVPEVPSVEEAKVEPTTLPEGTKASVVPPVTEVEDTKPAVDLLAPKVGAAETEEVPVEEVKPNEEVKPAAEVIPAQTEVVTSTITPAPAINGLTTPTKQAATPTTPTKHAFPTGSPESSPKKTPSSKFDSKRSKKRTSSILEKIKHIFHHDKEKEKEEAVKTKQ